MKIVLLKLAALTLLSGNHANAADNLRGGVIRAAGIAVADEYNPNNKSAAQKRQDQRDSRRSYTNPNRSQAEEDRERQRKANQFHIVSYAHHVHSLSILAWSRNNRLADPNDPNEGQRYYDRNGNIRDRIRCYYRGPNCNYDAASGYYYYAWNLPAGKYLGMTSSSQLYRTRQKDNPSLSPLTTSGANKKRA
eukprot:scaffold5317_cov178-Alexandrium_tamarense.AAC.2